MNFQKVIIREPHNIEKTRQLIKNTEIRHEEFTAMKNTRENQYLTIVFPDQGAWDRYKDNLELIRPHSSILVFEKKRDQSSGKIIGMNSDIETWKDNIAKEKLYLHQRFLIVK